ncbi:hypothetical protein H0N99_03855 [Candidatus Micrarchaeota archaeon]|nr:hypothetical protein [Candidatus Micrarchaeota archaeon]
MVDMIRIIEDSYELYKEKWRSVITAFAVVFLIALVFGIVNFVISLPGQLGVCEVKNALILLVFCISPYILQYILGFVNSLINLMVTMAVIGPMDEMAGGKAISSWTSKFPKQLVNSILVILFRTILAVICFGPIVILVILNISALVALGNNKNIGVLLGGGLIIILMVLGVCILVFAILNFLLMFLEIEVVLGGSGVLQAGIKSAKLVTSNLWDVLAYAVVWFVIGIAVGILTLLVMCTVCLLPLAYVITPLIVAPIELLSKVILWRKLNKSG